MNFQRVVLFSTTFLCASFCQTGFPQPKASDATEALQKFAAYEDKLKTIKDDQEKIQFTREFLDSLKDSGSKVVAIERLGSRYVYFLPIGAEGKLLAPYLEDADPRVRAAAATTIGYLGQIGRTKVTVYSKQLLTLVDDPDWQVRANVLYAMGHSGDDQFLAPLQGALNDPNANVRQAANFELGVWRGIQQLKLPATAQAQVAAVPTLTIDIAVPVIENLNRDPNNRPIVAFDHHSHFPVVITNNSGAQQRVIEGSSSWGAKSLWFKIIDKNGKQWEVRSGRQSGSKNLLHWFDLLPRESVVVDVDFANADQWEGFPVPPIGGESQTVTMRAVFEVEPSDAIQREGLWSGRVESDAKQYTFENRMPDTRGPGSQGIVAATGEPFGKVEAALQNAGMGSDQQLKSLTVTSNGHEMQIPERALKGIERPLTDTLEIIVEPDKNGQSTLCISFNLGKPDSAGPDWSPKRLSYCFQNGKFLNRITTTTLTKVVDQENP